MTPHTVLVPYDGSDDADQMLRLACHTVGEGGRVVVLALTEVHRALPLAQLPGYFDEPALAALHRVWELSSTLWLEERRIAIERIHRRTYDAAATVLREADAIEADAIFMTIKQPRFSWLPVRLGATVRAVMRRSRRPVFMGRFPASDMSTPDVLAEAERVLDYQTR